MNTLCKNKRIGKFLLSLGTLFFLTTACAPRRAQAQFIGYTSPQTVQIVALNAVNAPTTATVPNIGQNMHFLSYTRSGTVNIFALRLEGSNDGTNFFPISDDAFDVPISAGVIYAVGYYPVVRVNLLAIVGGGTITASYSGTSGSSSPPTGNTYTTGLQSRKLVFSRASQGTTASATILTPYNSSGGSVFISSTQGANFPAGSTINVGTVIANSGLNFPLPSTSLTGVSSALLPVAFDPSSSVTVTYTSGGASANDFSVWYLFTPTGPMPSAQPAITLNSESTSAVNTAVTKSISNVFGMRVYLFSVSARCSAGTAGLTVKDGVAGTTIWTSAAAEVGTTSFKFQWNPGLASSTGNGMDITLGACGAGNTGTLDVQASQL